MGKGKKKSSKRAQKVSKAHEFTKKEKGKKQGQHRPWKAPEEAAAAGPNPYEVFQNGRRRNRVLGERRSGENRNLTKSRARAHEERARGLLKESLVDRRTSTFRDARLGGDADTDAALTGASGGRSSVQRLVKLRQRQSKKSFALGAKGTEDLTHGGKRLHDLQDADLREGEEESGDEQKWDPNDPLANAIEQSKLKKAEDAKEKHEREEQVASLDAEFGDLMGELSFRAPKAQLIKSVAKKEGPDEYDRLMRELTYERKATATERLKTPEEIAREKAEELADLERERSARATPAEISIVKEGADEGQEEAGPEPQDQSEHESEFSEASDEGEESEEEDAEDEEPCDGEDEANVADKTSDVSKQVAERMEVDVDDDDKLGEDCIPLLSAKQVGVVDVRVNAIGEEGLPYSLECPSRRRQISELLAGKGPETAVKLVHRVRTCTAVSLAAGNREKLRAFFLALLDYVANAAVRHDGDLSAMGLQTLYALRPQLVQLAREHPEEAHSYFSEQLRVLSPTTLPRVTEVCCLKLIALIFPPTDFQHAITSPAILLADHWATRIATLGAEIEDLISEAIFLWGTLYEFVAPAGRFSTSFFKLGITILDSCWASSSKGRDRIIDASADVLALLIKALHNLAEVEPAGARAVVKELLRPTVDKAIARGDPDGASSNQLKRLSFALDDVSRKGLAPLALFDGPRPQIKMLEPIFHEEGDTTTRRRGMELTETQMLKKQLNTERRGARRQLRRDAATLQTLAAEKDDKRRGGRVIEKKRVWRMMDVEKQELRQMMTEGGGMDTSLQRYSKNKEAKRLNPRMAGNQVAAKDGTKAAAGDAAGATKAHKTPKKKGKGH